MRIEIGKYIIVSDPQCMWIEEKYTGETKKGEEKEYTRRVSGYVRTFKELLENFAEHKIRESTARDVKELLADFADCEKELRKIAEGVECKK